MAGILHIVATPIGNLSDLSDRARQCLEKADLIACEDTRRSGRLVRHLGLKKKLISLHEHNEADRIPQITEALAAGQRVVLLSDAGTPLLSDPGFPLVRQAIADSHTVEAVPGASAILAALTVSGLPPYPFTFFGFPPAKSGKRRRAFTSWAALDHTIVFFESPHRILASLADAAEAFGTRSAAAGRELTKMHEEVLRGDLASILERLENRSSIKGEFTVVIGPPAKD